MKCILIKQHFEDENFTDSKVTMKTRNLCPSKLATVYIYSIYTYILTACVKPVASTGWYMIDISNWLQVSILLLQS